MLPVGTSPMPASAMNAVIVCIASVGSKVRSGVPPAAMTTIIVSPTAREIAEHERGHDARERRGHHHARRHLQLVAAQRQAPSRRPPGTADIASSDSEATVGRIMIPITRPAESALKTPGFSPMNQMSWSSGVTKVSAKKP